MKNHHWKIAETCWKLQQRTSARSSERPAAYAAARAARGQQHKLPAARAARTAASSHAASSASCTRSNCSARCTSSNCSARAAAATPKQQRERGLEAWSVLVGVFPASMTAVRCGNSKQRLGFCAGGGWGRRGKEKCDFRVPWFLSWRSL